MATAETFPIADTAWSLVDILLREQQEPTAVDRFAQVHTRQDKHAQVGRYRELIPLTEPGRGEQYAFEVDLDACSGCKACVVACHNLNGLEDNELWRNVGLLHGGCNESPILQHVTTACHHCIEPACLEGCPVNAYEKDALTGIVRHLDDQCIGCQYCMLKCPYDVPKYSKSKGIVRKCDMCRDRLAVGEAPACVQSCPNEAIRIRVVDQQAIVGESETNQFLPGAPEPSYTLPATIYKSAKPLPRNTLPADYYSVQRGHSHLPLVVMLVLTQMSVGAFVVEQVLHSRMPWTRGGSFADVRPMHLIAALLLGFLGLGASVLHLGRPLYAYRALLGLHRSWLSREILLFGVFAGTAAVYVGIACLDAVGIGAVPRAETACGILAAVFGGAGVFCSIMIYVDTRRPFWNAAFTGGKFVLTAAVLGIPTALFISLVGAGVDGALTVKAVMSSYGGTLCRWVIVAVAAKLVFESAIFLYLRQRQHTPLKRTAMLLAGELSMTVLIRVFFGAVGGVVLPLILIGEGAFTSQAGFQPAFVGIVTLLMIGLLTAGELIERYLFFTASVAPKMPGGPAG